ncbi:bifunctional lytic transglycosylase/C40 family peptidase [Spirillospora sp. NPDC029432]|uniref:C40 family peptidase n=1 Tax=Spirillospora sp. NPDC029432 TaxID=3154599 RepID=UPI0034556926
MVLLGDAEAACTPGPSAAQPGVSEAGENTIPANYLRLYQKAGQEYGVGWHVLAGIGKVETDHGRSKLPGVHSGENGSGAGGPMQFIGPTWDAYGVDGNGDDKRDRYNPEDAIPGAANYLKANGAGDPARLRKAIWHYNHADWYVDLVLEWARKYGSNKFTTGGDNTAGTQTCGGAVSGPAGPVVGRVLAFARAQLGTPYQWGGTCTNARKDYASPQNCDCSSLTMRAYASAGITIPRVTYDQWAIPTRVPSGQERAGDLVFFRPGTRGPEHVALVVDPVKRTMIHAPQTGDVVKYDSYMTGRTPMGFIRPQAKGGAS